MRNATLRLARTDIGKLLLSVHLLLSAAPARADPPAPPRSETQAPILHELNRAMVRLAERVSPAVVQIQVTGYRPAGPSRRSESPFVARQHALGSGVVVDPDGYILTNHHVVRGAERIQVLIPAAPGAGGAEDAGKRRFDARVVGAEPDLDLAVLKVEASGLRALRLDASATVRQGELVFAIGSPEGLDRTVTMGVVGSAAREVPLSSQEMAFIQTDAPINPGNSGGPLVNVDGALVGINTFIVSESGGSQGLGFAIPAAMARIVYESLRRDGRVHLVEAGLGMQPIDRVLAAALGLPRDWGVVVGDVAPGGPAHAAGVQPGDVVASIDGRQIDNLAAVTTARYLHRPDEPVRLVVLRGDKRLALSIEPKEKPRVPDLADLASPETSVILPLGVIGLDVGPSLRGLIPPLRMGTGVVVAARTLDTSAVESGLQPGDVIHAVNRTAIASIEELRRALRALKRGDPVAIQIEREGKLAFLSFEME